MVQNNEIDGAYFHCNAKRWLAILIEGGDNYYHDGYGHGL